MQNRYITQALIYDFISLPIAPYQHLYSNVNSKRLRRIASELSVEFDRIFRTISNIQLIFLLKRAKYRTYYLNMTGVPKLQLFNEKHLAFYSEIIQTEEKSSVESIIALLEDNNVMKDSNTIKIWISFCFHTLVHFNNSRDTPTSPGLYRYIEQGTPLLSTMTDALATPTDPPPLTI